MVYSNVLDQTEAAFCQKIIMKPKRNTQQNVPLLWQNFNQWIYDVTLFETPLILEHCSISHSI